MKTEVVEKKLKNTASKAKCIVFDLGGGVKAQHPVSDESEAQAIAAHYQTLHNG